MHIRPLLIVAICLALSACSVPSTAQPTITLAPTPTEEVAEQPAPTNTPAPRPTTIPKPTTADPAVPQATAAAPTEVASNTEGFQPGECLFDKPAGVEVECGTLTVPENRQTNTGKTIELAVAIFKSPNPNPEPDPIIYLEGGPGGHALQLLDLSFNDRFAPFMASRDLILFDQRGVGSSKPALECDEYTKFAYDMLDQNLPLEEDNRRYIAVMKQCHDRLAKQGIDFSAYNSIESAADIEALRTALGYEQINLFGSSYGTRLALTTMREYPDGIRSVVLDSTRPLQSKEASTPADIDRSFTKLFDGCANDPDCNKAFPNLRETFFKLVDKLNTTPATGQATSSLSGKVYQVILSGDDLISVVNQALYSSSLIADLPKAIVAAEQGEDTSYLIRLALFGTIQSEFISFGMFYSVRCNEEVAFETAEELAAGDDAFPQYHGVLDQSSYSEICPFWNAGTAPAVEDQPVTSDIPTLILAGEYDPATPPDDGRLAGQTLSNSFYFEFPGLAHGVSGEGDCPIEITNTFLDDPTTKPDDSCIAQMSGMVFNGTGAAVTLEPVTNTDMGFTTVIPQGWEEISSGIYAKDSSSSTALLLIAFPADQAATLDRLQGALNLEGDGTSSGDRKTDKLDWTLYEYTREGQPIDVALADGADRTYVVMLISDTVDRDILFDQIFLPAIDQFEPTT